MPLLTPWDPVWTLCASLGGEPRGPRTLGLWARATLTTGGRGWKEGASPHVTSSVLPLKVCDQHAQIQTSRVGPPETRDKTSRRHVCTHTWAHTCADRCTHTPVHTHMCIHVQRDADELSTQEELYCRRLAHAGRRAGGWRVRSLQGCDRLQSQELRLHLEVGSLLPQGNLRFALRDSHPQMRPTQVLQDHLLCVKSADCTGQFNHVHHIPS